MRAVALSPTADRIRLMSTGLLLSIATAILIGALLAVVFGAPGWDSRFAYLSAADAVLDGRSPYPLPDDPVLKEDKAYVYPPQLAIAYTPLAPLPIDVGTGIAVFMTLAALLGALAVVGVRDIRCYAVVLLWSPAVNALENANVSALLTLGIALAWRYRATVWPLAAVLGLAVSTKVVLWPLLVWTAVTRRTRATVLAVLVGVGVTLGAWAVIGFAGLTGYPDLVSAISDIQAERSYSIAGIAASLGLDPLVGRVAMFVIGAALIAGCWRYGRSGDDRRAFTCAIVAGLVFSPIVWQHYLMFLVVPLALARPRFSAAWLVPLALWLSPRLGHGDAVQALLPAVVVGALLYLMLAAADSRRPVIQTA